MADGVLGETMTDVVELVDGESRLGIVVVTTQNHLMEEAHVLALIDR